MTSPTLTDPSITATSAAQLSILLAQRTAELAAARAALNRYARQQRESEEALHTSELWLQQIINLAPVCISAKNEDGRYILANVALARIYNTSVEALLGKTDLEFVASSAEAEAFRTGDLAVLEQGAAIDLPEQRITTASGDHRVFHTTKIPFTTGIDGERAVLGVSADVTARVKAEEELLALNNQLEERIQQRTAELAAANKELEAFAYSVSHDLRSPLRGIDGWSQALLEDYGSQLDERASGYLARVREEIQRMGRLIDDLLALSRLGRAELRLQRVDLSALIHAYVERVRTRDHERDVNISVQTGVVVKGDPVLLGAVVQNLIDNAWKFTARREEATITFSADHGPNGWVCKVQDNGAGFDMAHAARLFLPFQRLHTQREFPGSGIGLASAQRILQRHGSRIYAEGEPGVGATFRFTLEAMA